ncbi:hypothetical protein E1B28_005592 [Marasmius oreades]|uniref:Uncharacterized protein n=1 Tax=Marasmius oreades TaxID=181124 RepID=A0A9P7S4W2_9AGAR|nr:uncharacterized protein E1B28_005592 [Marasmius oreades]KAG7094776.1 hypothetical protein E1B28_005592 [Marasmius oreades]
MDNSAANEARSKYLKHLGEEQPVVVNELELAGLIDKPLTIPTDLLKHWLTNLKMATNMNKTGTQKYDLGGFGLDPPTFMRPGGGLRHGEFD